MSRQLLRSLYPRPEVHGFTAPLGKPPRSDSRRWNAAVAIAWTAVLMMVFEEVEGISRLQAFGISAGINVCFFLVQLLLTPVTRHL